MATLNYCTCCYLCFVQVKFIKEVTESCITRWCLRAQTYDWILCVTSQLSAFLSLLYFLAPLRPLPFLILHFHIIQAYNDGGYTRYETLAFALTKCLMRGGPAVREAGYKAAAQICKTPEQLMLFAKYTRIMKTGYYIYN